MSRKMSRKPLWLACLSALAVPSVFAQTTSLQAITLSASPIHQHDVFEVPTQVESLAQDDLQELATGSLGELLDGMVGVNNLAAGSQSGKPVIRGLTGERVKVLSNGAATDYQAYGTRHLPNVDTYLADRVEVVRGPQSVLYGSDALGGVVNIIQPEIPFAQNFKGEAATEFNSNNQETQFGVKLGAGNENWGWLVGASQRKGDNFTVPEIRTASAIKSAVPDSRPLFVGEVPNTNFANRSANIGLGYQDDAMALTLRHTHWQADQNYLGIELHNGEFEALATGQALSNDETQVSAEFFQGDWVLKPSWVYTQNNREASHNMPYETMVRNDEYLDLSVQRHDWKFAAEHPKVGDFEGEIGVELSQAEQQLLLGHLTPSADVDRKAIYAFEEADYDQWLVQFGARYDWVDVYAPLDGNNEHFVDGGIFDDSNNERAFAVWSGSLGATYRLDSAWSLAGNLARGFRAPSVFELYAGGEHGGVQAYQIGNPELVEEIALNADISLRWQNDKTQMMATVYQNTIDNYIYLANSKDGSGNQIYHCSEAGVEAGLCNEDDTSTTQSAGYIPQMEAEQTDARIQGLELSLNHQWTPQWQSNVSVELISGKDQNVDRDLPLIPANNLRATVSYSPLQWRGLREQKWTLEGKFVAAKDSAGAYEPFSQFDAMSIGTASTKAYQLFNLRYQGKVKLDQNELTLNFAVENIFDTAYVDFLDTYKGYTLGMGRNFKFGARLAF